MDINNDLQQINTFVKGMNTDVSDALMDSSQYRYAENVRLTTNTEENTGELRLIEGTKSYYNVSEYGSIKAMTSVRNLLVVVTEKDGKSYILVNDTDNPSHWWITYESESGDTFGEYLSLVTRWESDNNVKLYIADAKHPLMYVNITEKDEQDRYITHTGNKSISGIINTFLELPTFLILLGGGNLNAPKIQYAYRLYKLGGSTTMLSPLSEIITLYQEDNKGYETLTETTYKINKSIIVNIPSNTSLSDQLLIFRISYIQQGLNPQVSLIYDDVYVDSYTDTGFNVDDNVSYATFLSYMDFNTVPRVIESKNDYLFQANINDVLSKMDSKYDDIDISDCIHWSITNKEVYVSNKNEKRYGLSSNNVQDLFRSLRLGEVYRYGVVLYDNDGNHTSVKHIDDIDLQTAITNNSEYSIEKASDRFYRFKLIGIDFEVDWNSILQKCPECAAIEIVRCDRTINDRRTITQGIAGYPLSIYDKKESGAVDATGNICSPGLISTNRFAIVGHISSYDPKDEREKILNRIAVSDSKQLIFASPEYVYEKDDILDVLKNKSFYISHDGFAEVDTYQYQESLEDVEFKPQQLNLRRIFSRDNKYDYGVPYSVYKTPTEIKDLYRWMQDRYSTEGNGQPPYEDYVNGITTYIHTAWIATYFAKFAYDHQDSNYHVYINKRDMESESDPKPKVYMSSSEFNTTFDLTPTNETGISDNLIFSTVPKAEELFDFNSNSVLFNAESISTGGEGVLYLNWIVPIAYGEPTDENMLNNPRILVNSDKDYAKHASGGTTNYFLFLSRTGWFTYPIGSTGECMIINKSTNGSFYSNAGTKVGLEIVSIKHTVTPYGGDSTIKSSKYISYGNIMPADSGIKHYDIYDGDCYPGVFIYNASHAWFEVLGNAVAQANILSVPLYSDIDLSGTFGDLIPNKPSDINKPYWFLDIPCNIDGYIQNTSAYRYNTSYNSDPTAVPYTSIKYTSIDTDTFDTRVQYSSPKTNGEHIDSWLNFDPNNYIDVDSRFGQITNMRLFKDKLLFWQEHATGILSVNERTILNDTNDNDIIIGSGDVLSRYDYISTVYGMKPFLYDAEVQSNTTQYWWDGYNKEILAYAGGMELVPMTKIKGVTNYINQREESEHPMLVYDTKYDEVLALVVGDETLVYAEQIQAFSSIYTFMPQYRANIGNDIYLATLDLIYQLNKQDVDNYSYLFDKPAFPKVRTVVNKNNIYTKTFDNLTFGGRMYKGSLPTIVNWPMQRGNGMYVEDEHLNAPMHHLVFTFETPLKLKSAIRGDKATSVDEYDYRLAIPRNGFQDLDLDELIKAYGNRMRGKTMQCEIASDYNSTDFSLQYITTKFRMSWS